MGNRTTGLVGVVAAAVMAYPVAGTLSVRLGDGSLASPADAEVVFNPLNGHWNVTLKSLYNPGGETVYDVYGDGGEIIDNVFIDVPCWTDGDGNCIPAGSPVYVEITGQGAGIHTIHNIEQRGDAETLLLLVDVRNDIGSITAEVIGTVRAGRDVTGDIVSTTTDHAHRGVFWVEAERDILGDVRTAEGRIGRVWAYRNMGTAANPIALVARHGINGIMAADPTCLNGWLYDETTTCGGEIHADIDTHLGGAGTAFRFVCSLYDGTFRTQALAPDWFTGTPGRMSMTSRLEGTIIMDDAFDHPEQWIEIGPGGLEGQIIVNALGTPGNGWSSPVYIGPRQAPERVLLGPSYNDDASDLGGGSIALAPFGLHATSCVPASGDSIEPGLGETPTLRLRHYGPVTIAGPAPLSIERRPIGGSLFLPVPLSNATVALDVDENTVVVTGPAIQAGYEFRVMATAQLHMKLPDLDAPVVWSDEYYGTIEAPTFPGDLDGNGQVNLVDLLIVLSNWGAADHMADLNGNGNVELGDLLIVLSHWG